jgi:hypothetical protein
MKKLLLFTFVLFSISLFPQASVEKIFYKSYDELPFKIRIENSGIYGAAMFDVQKDVVTLSAFDSPSVFQFRNSAFFAKKALKEYPVDLSPEKQQDNSSNYKTSVAGRTALTITSNNQSDNKNITLSFANDLAYADVIGTDAKGDIFLIVEKYITEIPLKVKREVYTLSSAGNILSILEIPSVKYLYTLKDFQVDEDGNLFHFFSDKDKICIYKWSKLTDSAAQKIKYPFEFDYEYNFNDFTPTNEPVINKASNFSPESVTTLSSRLTALKIGESYALHRYQCTQQNITLTDATAQDGDLVRSPSWLVTGSNARIPYKWGGCMTLSTFDAGLKSGLYAGDINTKGVTDYAVGVDCSGFVSQCWQISYHTTSDMPSITTQYTSWDSLRPGDAVHKVGHVRLFVEKNANGSIKVVESSARDWSVSYWTYTPSDLTAYTPRCYINMVSSYSMKRPDIISAITDSASSDYTNITWSCDTTGIAGYRLYVSSDGTNFTLAQDEKTIKTTSVKFKKSQSAQYFRVSSVTNSSSAVESAWSEIKGIANFSGSTKVLVVDGYERQDGAWRGAGNPFVYNYEKELAAKNTNFESSKNSQLQNSSVNLNNYNAVYWLLGDESTVEETFNATEQTLVKKYLENGGSLFVSGSEIGWDLSYKGNVSDKAFFNDYLKASFVSDASGVNLVKSADTSALSGNSFYIAQTYAVDYPDVIAANGGSRLCLLYSNSKGAGVQYTGSFGASTKQGKVIYLAFPLETTANDTCFSSIISQSLAYFSAVTSVNKNETTAPNNFSLSQNYPNPFNPSTTIRFSIPKAEKVSLKVFDVLGREAATLVNEIKNAGSYQVLFNAKISSGIYFYRLQTESFTETKRMILLK